MMIEIVAPGACAVPSDAMDVRGYDFGLDAQADAEFDRERARFDAEQSLLIYDDQTRIANGQIAHGRLTKLYPFIFSDFELPFADWVVGLGLCRDPMQGDRLSQSLPPSMVADVD